MTTQSRAEIVVSAVDKASATLNQISAKLESVTKPAGDLSRAFGNLYKATGLAAVKSAVGGLTSSLAGLATATVGIAGVYSGTIGSVIGFANHAVDAADKIGDLSERYHIASKDLQVYGSLMEEAGVGSVEDAAASLGKLQKAMNEAINGGKEQAAAFAGVGIGLAELKKMKPDEVIARMADAFQGSDRDLQKNAVLLELMGKNGGAWMSIMDKGGSVIRERYEQMVADGRILSREQIEQADQYDKAWRRMSGTIDGVKTSLGLQLSEKLQPLVESVQKWVVANRALIQSKFDKFLEKLPAIIELGKDMFEGLWNVAQVVGSVFKGLNAVLGPTAAALLMLAGIMSPVILAGGQLAFSLGKVAWLAGGLAMQGLPYLMTAFRAVWAVVAANPIGLVVAAIAGLAYVVYSNWDSIVSYVEGAWGRIKSVFDVGFFDGLIQVWLESWQALANGILGIVKSIVPDRWMPKALQDFNFTFATNREQRLTAAQAAQSQRQDISNRITLKIDAEGRARVTEMQSGSPQTEIDVMSGLAMVGS